MGAVTTPGTGAMAWLGQLAGGTQGDKVHVRV
jgi:hypothetical protein